MKKPVIGISGSIIVDSGGMFPGYKRSYVNNDYVASVIKNGGIPLIIPFNTDDELISEQISCIDALILTGGHDVDPFLYGEEPSQKLGEIFPERDSFDFTLIKYAKEKNIPILGICRGYQIINVYHGGSLYQDLSYKNDCFVKHWQAHSSELVTHTVNIDKDSKLYSMFDSEEIRVNSFHHQILKDIPDNFRATAHAKDGVIEAIEAQDYRYLVAVQWHPEMLHNSVEKMNNIFKSLIEEAKHE